MNARYEKDLQQSWLILEAHVVYKEDYQLQMIKRNQLQGILPMLGKGENEESCYWYNISGKVSMRSWYQKRLFQCEDMERFMKRLVEVLKEIQNYLLHTECLILEPEYIYYDGEQFFFCYYPAAENYNIREAFHKLTEYFVKMVDYEEKEGIYLAYELHKGSMEENYNLEQMLDGILERKEAQLKEIYGEKKKTLEESCDECYITDEDEWLDDWVGAREMVGETPENNRKSVWGYVKYALKRKKKNPWGNWDSLKGTDEEV